MKIPKQSLVTTIDYDSIINYYWIECSITCSNKLKKHIPNKYKINAKSNTITACKFVKSFTPTEFIRIKTRLSNTLLTAKKIAQIEQLIEEINTINNP
jgi:hypothetical protein